MSAEAPLEHADGLLLSRDLFFTSKVTSTAGALGRSVVTVGNPARAAELIVSLKPRAVFVDLAAGDLVAPTALAHYRSLAPATPFVAFGSHVDTAALAAAAAAGCDPVLPRSAFSTRLPELLRQLLSP
ncbi:MAG TPA: response regulator [Isosphaeraceae bacterium]|jgi:DNA-binding NarL/FixJ family response regulator|nr:response regulator [Isosphaeraceae bacterium]